MSLGRRTLLFAMYLAGVVLANWGVVRALVDFSQRDATQSYVVLIPVVTIALLFQERHAIFGCIRTDWRAGGAVFIVGGALVILGALALPMAAADLSARVCAIVLLAVGGFIVVYGREAARRALFPLVFLAFTIPIPAPVLAGAVQVLKIGSTEAVDGLFALSGTVYHRDGFVFSLPGVVIEVADECSGIRSSIGLLLTGLLAGHLFLNKGWTKSVLLAAVLPMAILKNAIRIAALTLLSVHVDPGFLTGQLHHEGGIVFFLLALVLAAPILITLRSMETLRSRRPRLAV